MSFLFFRRDKDGKVEVTSATIPFEYFFILLSCMFVFIYNMFVEARAGVFPKSPLYLICLGFLLFTASKISQLRKAVWVSWGCRAMSSPVKAFYVIGLFLDGVGIILLLFVPRVMV
ncbi:MAG: hypothetical protein AB1898_30500 [Acidobacteriota bacterium]